LNQFVVYILVNPQGGFYIGHSDDVARRLSEHNDSERGLSYTHKNGPWELVWTEPYPDRASAINREKQIKRMKSARWIRKNLLSGRVPTRRD
jgi:predicted GIY-YIG superfamily endonuclease